MRTWITIAAGLFVNCAAFAADAPPEVAADQIAGTVTGEDGQPIEGATVADLWSNSQNHVSTDKDGHFLLKKLETNPKPLLTFNKSGYAQSVSQQAAGSNDVTIALSNKTWLEGNVLAPDGSTPVPDALIRADSGSISASGYMMPSVWTQTQSDAQGHFHFLLAPGKYDVQVRVPKVGVSRFNATLGDGDTQTHDIQLDKGITFTAKCIDSETGDPVAGVHLSNGWHKDIDGKSDDSGNATIDGMQPGKFDFDIEEKGYTRWWSDNAMETYQRTTSARSFDNLSFNMQPDMEPVTITLEKAVTITGHVLDPEGNPVAGATVAPAKTGSGNSLTGDTRFSVRTKKDGSFTMSLPASNDDRHNLEAHDGDYNKTRKWANGVGEPFQSKPGQKIEDVKLTLTDGATVKGHVVDASGNPQADKEVRAISTDGLDNRYYVPSTRTNTDGNYELKHIRPGEEMIQIEPFWLQPGQAPGASSQTVTLQAKEVKEGVDLTAVPQR